MNTSPVRMDDLPLNGFHCRIAALTFGAHLTDGYVLGVVGYAIIQLTPAMQLTPFMTGMIGGSALLGLFLGSLVLGWISDHIGRQKIFTFSFVLITIASFFTAFRHLAGTAYWFTHPDWDWAGRRLFRRAHSVGRIFSTTTSGSVAGGF